MYSVARGRLERQREGSGKKPWRAVMRNAHYPGWNGKLLGLLGRE